MFNGYLSSTRMARMTRPEYLELQSKTLTVMPGSGDVIVCDGGRVETFDCTRSRLVPGLGG